MPESRHWCNVHGWGDGDKCPDCLAAWNALDDETKGEYLARIFNA